MSTMETQVVSEAIKPPKRDQQHVVAAVDGVRRLPFHERKALL